MKEKRCTSKRNWYETRSIDDTMIIGRTEILERLDYMHTHLTFVQIALLMRVCGE